VAFEAGRKAVLQQFGAMGEEADMSTTMAKEEGEKQKERMLEDLGRKNEELAAKTEAEKARLAELKEKLGYDLEKIDSDQRKLQPDLQTVQGQMTALRRDLAGIDERIASLAALAQREQKQEVRQRYLDDAAHWQLQRNQRVAALRDVERRAMDLNSRNAALVAKRREIDLRWQRESGRAEKLQGTLSRVRGEREKLAGQSVTGITSAVRDQKRRSVALTAYVPLPVSLEEEKARLVESFR
jgi:chromosome segregation ATPase